MSPLRYSGRGGRRLVEVLRDPSQVDLGFAPNVETASRREKAQNAAWVHVGREMGNVDSIREELVRMNRDRPGQSLGLPRWGRLENVVGATRHVFASL